MGLRYSVRTGVAITDPASSPIPMATDALDGQRPGISTAPGGVLLATSRMSNTLRAARLFVVKERLAMNPLYHRNLLPSNLIFSWLSTKQLTLSIRYRP